MKNEHDMDLVRLFEERHEPAQDEIFVKRVSKRIALLRFTHRAVQILLVGAGVAILAVLTPWLMGAASYITLGPNLFAYSVVAMILSPVGWAIGGGAGLFFFLQMRS
jgi:cell shape-determining protein MreD